MVFQVIDVQPKPEQEKAHKDLVKTFTTQLDQDTNLDVTTKLSMLLRLQQVTSNLVNVGGKDISAKKDTLLEMNNAGAIPYPCIVWVHWKEGAQLLEKHLGKEVGTDKVALMMGDTPEQDRDTYVQNFRKGHYKYLILGTQVGRFGLTLIEAKSMVYFDRTFDSDAHIQSLHRVQRIGLKHKPLVITLRSPGTVDMLVEANLAGKMQSIAQITNANLKVLLESLSGEYQ